MTITKANGANTRVYFVHYQGDRPRLVRTITQHRAERHVVGELVTSRIATKEDLIDLLQAGVQIEEVVGDPDNLPLPL